MSKLVAMAAAAALGLGATQAFAASTVLNFEGLTSGAAVPQTYGDNATNTPNVVAIWGDGNAGNGVESAWSNAGGEWGDLTATNPTWVSYSAGDGTDLWQLTLDADAGYQVVLESFTLYFAGVDSNANDVVNVAWNSDDNTEDGSVNISGSAYGTPQSGLDVWSGDGGTIVLTWNDTTGVVSAIDNITFRQEAIPEPGALALLGVGGLALLRRRRA